MLMKRETTSYISTEKLLVYLGEHGAEATAAWYAKSFSIPLEEAGYKMAKRVMKEAMANDEFDDSLIDLAFARLLWRKFIDDCQLAKIIAEVSTVNRFCRETALGCLFMENGIDYPHDQWITEAVFAVFPEARSFGKADAELLVKLVCRRLKVDRSQVLPQAERNDDANGVGGFDDSTCYDDDIQVDEESPEEDSSSEWFYHFQDE